MPYLQEQGWAAGSHGTSGEGSGGDGAGAADATEADRSRLAGLLPLIKERLKTLSDVTDLLRFVYEDVNSWNVDDLIPKKATASEALVWLDAAAAVVTERPLPDAGDEQAEEQYNEALRAAADAAGTKLGNLMMPLRVAITGSRVSPPLVGSIRELGLEETKRRIAGARAVLHSAAE